MDQWMFGSGVGRTIHVQQSSTFKHKLSSVSLRNLRVDSFMDVWVRGGSQVISFFMDAWVRTGSRTYLLFL